MLNSMGGEQEVDAGIQVQTDIMLSLGLSFMYNNEGQLLRAFPIFTSFHNHITRVVR